MWLLVKWKKTNFYKFKKKKRVKFVNFKTILNLFYDYRDLSKVRLETETFRPRLHPWLTTSIQSPCVAITARVKAISHAFECPKGLSKWVKNLWRLGLCPGPHWGAYDWHTPIHPTRLVRRISLTHTPPLRGVQGALTLVHIYSSVAGFVYTLSTIFWFWLKKPQPTRIDNVYDTTHRTRSTSERLMNNPL